MTRAIKWVEKLFWFSESVCFFRNHFFTIFCLGLVAALGRATQLGAFGLISGTSNIFLEIIVESVRILIFLYTLGLTNVRTGASSIIRFFSNRESRRRNWNIALQQLKKQWFTLLLNVVVFLVFAWLINFLIEYAAYQTCLYTNLKASTLISDKASEWAFILFFKNISVIPFALVFNALFLLWITNRLTHSLIFTNKNQ